MNNSHRKEIFKMKNKKIEFKIKSWGQINLNTYDKIITIGNDEELSDTEKDIALIALLCDVPEEDIWDMSIEEVQGLRVEMSWLNDFSYPKDIKFSKINIGDYRCNVCTDLQKMSIAQYVDFQTYFKDWNKYKAELLSVFFIPDGCKYNDGYETTDLIDAIREHVDIVTFNSVCFFFLRKYHNLMHNSLTSLESMTRVKLMLMRKTNPMRKKHEELLTMIKELRQTYIFG